MNNKLVVIGSGQYNYDTIKLREYPNGFVIGKRNETVERVLFEEVGGTCGNVMCILAHYGWLAQPQVKLIDSDEGHRLADSLMQFGCDTRYISFDPNGGFCGMDCVHRRSRKTGEHELGLHSYGPDGSRFQKITELRARDEVPAFLESLDTIPNVYFFDHNTAGPRMIAKELHSQGTLVFYECENCRDWKAFLKCISVADIVKFSDENVPDVSFCASYPDKLFIQTLGTKGLRFKLPNKGWWHIPALSVNNVVDWEGCGDTITAVFINELGKIGLPKMMELTESQVKSALETATECASLCTQFYGSKTWITK